jgi:hypothetical protein
VGKESEVKGIEQEDEEQEQEQQEQEFAFVSVFLCARFAQGIDN